MHSFHFLTSSDLASGLATSCNSTVNGFDHSYRFCSQLNWWKRAIAGVWDDWICEALIFSCQRNLPLMNLWHLPLMNLNWCLRILVAPLAGFEFLIHDVMLHQVCWRSGTPVLKGGTLFFFLFDVYSFLHVDGSLYDVVLYPSLIDDIQSCLNQLCCDSGLALDVSDEYLNPCQASENNCTLSFKLRHVKSCCDTSLWPNTNVPPADDVVEILSCLCLTGLTTDDWHTPRHWIGYCSCLATE